MHTEEKVKSVAVSEYMIDISDNNAEAGSQQHKRSEEKAYKRLRRSTSIRKEQQSLKANAMVRSCIVTNQLLSKCLAVTKAISGHAHWIKREATYSKWVVGAWLKGHKAGKKCIPSFLI